MFTCSIDTSRANRLMVDINAALIGRGEASDVQTVLRDEARRLAVECADQTGPRSKGKLEKRIVADVRQFFFSGYKNNIVKGRQGTGDLRWFVAGPKFLYGIPPADDLRGTGGDLLPIYRERRAKRAAFRNNRTMPIGWRGKQTVYRITRMLVTKTQERALVKKLLERVGRAKAAWMESATRLGERNIPAWVSRHLPSPKARFEMNLASNKPFVLIGSRGLGVSRSRDRLQKAFNVRVRKMQARLKLILNGYRQDVKQGKEIQAGRHAAS